MISKNVCDKCKFLFVNKNNRYCAIRNDNLNDMCGIFGKDNIEYKLLKLMKLNNDLPEECPYKLEHVIKGRTVKLRMGFVSNSSSASFVVFKDKITPEIIEDIKNHIDIAYERFPNEWPRYQFLKEGHREHDPYSDQWPILESEKYIFGGTGMDNFEMDLFFRKLGLVEDVHFEFEGGGDSRNVIDFSKFSTVEEAKIIRKLLSHLEWWWYDKNIIDGSGKIFDLELCNKCILGMLVKINNEYNCFFSFDGSVEFYKSIHEKCPFYLEGIIKNEN